MPRLYALRQPKQLGGQYYAGRDPVYGGLSFVAEVKFARKFSTQGDIAAFLHTHKSAKLETVELAFGPGDEVSEIAPKAKNGDAA